MLSNHLILCHPLLLLSSIFASIGIFSSELALSIRWPKYWSFSISPSNEYSGWISFRMDWLDLLAVQGTLKSLRQHHTSKVSILQHPAFFMAQLSHLWASLIDQQVKNPPVLQETPVRSLGWEDPLEKGKAAHSSVLAWRTHELHGPWGRRESDTTERLSLSPDFRKSRSFDCVDLG